MRSAAEFSRHIDPAILTDPYNLTRLRSALNELKAEVIAVPPFDARYLRTKNLGIPKIG
jgi:hypothetical protein